VKLPTGRQIRVSEELGQGAEGVVCGIVGTADLCAKIYFDPAPDIEVRLEALKRHQAAQFGGDHGEHVHLSWPLERLVDGDGATIGLVMPRIDGVKLSALTDRKDRLDALNTPTWSTLVTIAERTARLVDRLHRAGVIVGDLSPANVLVTRTGHVTLIDCDTVQFVDPMAGQQHECRKITPDYAPPVSTDGSNLLTESHDDFSLAVLVTQLLMVGQHPYDGVPMLGSGDNIVYNINNQNDRIAFPERLVDVQGAIPATVLPPDVRALAVRCFGLGHRDLAQRPRPHEWTQVLSVAALQVMGCRNNVNHSYHRSLSECIWCERVQARLGDTFPAHTSQFAPPQMVPGSVFVPQIPAQAPPGQWSVSPPPRAASASMNGVPSVPWTPPPVPPAPRPSTPPSTQPQREPVPASSTSSNDWIGWVVFVVVAIIVLIAIFH